MKGQDRARDEAFWAERRQEFPLLSGKVYLASMCAGPLPRAAHRDVEEYLQGRAQVGRKLETWFDRIEEVTREIETLLVAPAGSVALRDTGTACQAAIASAVEPVSDRNRIVVTELDFHSSLHLWSAQTRRGFELVPVPSPNGIDVDVEAVLAAIDERTRVVAVSWVSRHNALLDVARVAARAREVGALTVIDAYQAVGVVPVDVQALGVDVLVAGTHKWLSGELGLAFMYVRPELAAQLVPAYPGWFGHAQLDSFVRTHRFLDDYTPMVGARRFQQGTIGMLPVYGSLAGLRFVNAVGADVIRARNTFLCNHLYDGCVALGVRVHTPSDPAARAGGLCLAVDDPEPVVVALAARGIEVEQRRMQVIRVAPHACVGLDDCNRFLAALGDVLRERAPAAVAS